MINLYGERRRTFLPQPGRAVRLAEIKTRVETVAYRGLLTGVFMHTNRQDKTTAKLVDDAIMIQIAEGTFFAAHLLYAHGIGLRAIVRILMHPRERRTDARADRLPSLQ